MAGRPSKAGLDYFELDCHFDSKVRLIQAEYGLKGVAIIVLLFQEIYGNEGYYMYFDEDRLLLFMSEHCITRDDKSLIDEIVKACVRREIFSKELFDRYQILTSAGIQKRYVNAVSKRKKVKLIDEFLLVKNGLKGINSDINSINSDINSINSVRNEQSRVEKSKEENIYIDSSESIRQKQVSDDFRRAVGAWNELENTGIKPVSRVSMNSKRGKMLNARIKEYGIDDVLKAVRKVGESDYLRGRVRPVPWFDFEWFVRPNNFPKVLEGKYDNAENGDDLEDW